MTYLVSWEWGIHHLRGIEVSEMDFFRIIDEMSEEFEIIKPEPIYDTSEGVEVQLYTVEDYCGNIVEIGKTLNKHQP